jgi:aminobenzoyl-glutamate utilization protein B
MKSMKSLSNAVLMLVIFSTAQISVSAAENKKLSGLKAEAVRLVEGNKKLTREIVDSLSSFSEPGIQEFESMRDCKQG